MNNTESTADHPDDRIPAFAPGEEPYCWQCGQLAAFVFPAVADPAKPVCAEHHR